MHTNERPYPCEVCSLKFKTKSNLYKHRKSFAHSLKLKEKVGVPIVNYRVEIVEHNNKVLFTAIISLAFMVKVGCFHLRRFCPSQSCGQ